MTRQELDMLIVYAEEARRNSAPGYYENDWFPARNPEEQEELRRHYKTKANGNGHAEEAMPSSAPPPPPPRPEAAETAKPHTKAKAEPKDSTADAEPSTNNNPILTAALDYIGRGWNPVPCDYRSKKPRGAKWQERVIDAGSAARFFPEPKMNIGLQMGPSSHGLTDADLDCAEAVALAAYVLPKTDAIFGRPSARDSHRLYETDLAVTNETATIEFFDPDRKDRDDALVLELRIGGKGAQTIAPPSTHKETGETIAWERGHDGMPAAVDGDDLLKRCQLLAALCLLARYWPKEGSGHHAAARVAGGFLARVGFKPAQVHHYAKAVEKAIGGRDDLARTARDAAQAYTDGENAFGFPALKETFGEKVADRIADWLNYQEPRDTDHDDSTMDGTTSSSQAGSWDDPDFSMFDDRRGELPEFPVDVFSKPLQDWLLRAAHGAGVRADHVAIPLLGIASGLIGTSRRVRASRSWSEPLALWACVVAQSGDRKTPGLGVSTRCLDLIEKDNAAAIQKARIAHETRTQKAREAKQKWKDARQAALDASPPGDPPPMPVEAIDPGDFISPRLYVTDPTIERLAQLMQARPRGMMLIRDELSGLFANMARYSGGSDRPFWLEAWNGGRYVVERKTGSVTVDHLMVGVVGAFQPDRLAGAFAGDEDGMSGRFLYGWPLAPAYRPLVNDVSEVEPEIMNLMTALIRLPAESEEGAFVPQAIWLSDEAVARFEQYRQRVDQQKHAFEGRERQWLSKSETHVLRLAGVLSYMAWGISLGSGTGIAAITGGLEPKTIDVVYMDAAIRLLDEYLWPHARASLRQIGLTDRHRDARRLLRWIKANRKTEISATDARREALGQSLDATQTNALLHGLLNAGWLKKETIKTTGRAAHRWLVNPKLFF